jgi:hypothetical protein
MERLLTSEAHIMWGHTKLAGAPMPRPPRIHIEGGFYHVILRGNHREDIFFQPEDRDRFESLVTEVIEHFRVRIHASARVRQRNRNTETRHRRGTAEVLFFASRFATDFCT